MPVKEAEFKGMSLFVIAKWTIFCNCVSLRRLKTEDSGEDENGDKGKKEELSVSISEIL